MEKLSRLDSEMQALQKAVANAYESSVTIPEAEKLAARCLHAQMLIAGELQKADLDSRMKKNGLKTMRATAYMETLDEFKNEKRPTEAFIDAAIVMNENCNKEQDLLDKAEVRRDGLEIMLGIFKDAHIYFRGISKGRYE